jgi:hypothetical protein
MNCPCRMLYLLSFGTYVYCHVSFLTKGLRQGKETETMPLRHEDLGRQKYLNAVEE